MRRYLELFTENFPADIADKLVSSNWPYVGYSMTEDRVIHAAIPEPEEPDPAAGYVDLGLSVMWASCNLGASSPEELGEKYKWGETDEHKSGEKEFTEFPNLSEHSYSYTYDAVTVSMKDNPYTKYLHYRIPTAELWQELIDNTTREVYTNSEGRNICKYTSNINGNYIVLPLLMQTEGNKNIFYKTTTPSSLNGKESSTSTAGKIIMIYSESSTTSVVSYFNDVKGDIQNNYVRGVCSYPPKTDIIQYGNSISSDSTYVLTSAHSIEITCPEDFTVYFSNTPDFIPDSSDENVVGYYTAQKHGGNYDRQISCRELSFGQSRHDYLYMCFVSEGVTDLTVSLWQISQGLASSVLIQHGQPFINDTSGKTLYRMYYKDWVDYDLTVSWSGTKGNLSIYLSSYWNGFTTTSPDRLAVLTVGANSYKTVTAEQVNTWSTSLEPDGFIYILMSTIGRKGNVTFTSAKPAEEIQTSSEAYSIAPVAISTTSSIDCGCETE